MTPSEFFEFAIRKQQRKADPHKFPHMMMGHLVGAILSIHNLRDAKLFREGYIKWTAANIEGSGSPESIVDSNIGWCFGEGMPDEDRKIWVSLGASHPVFGAMERTPTPEESFRAGYERAKDSLAKSAKKGKIE